MKFSKLLVGLFAGALIALIPLGVWFERNTIRRK